MDPHIDHANLPFYTLHVVRDEALTVCNCYRNLNSILVTPTKPA